MIMEVKTSAQLLQRSLIHHEKAKAQIKLIEHQVQRQQRLAERSFRQGQKGQALHYLGVKSVIQSVGHYYSEYSLQRWIDVQLQARLIMTNMDPGRVLPPLVVPESESHCEDKYHHALVVAHCNFSRTG